MLASRDQENLLYGQQAAAASKPLNQGVRQLAPKTPGNKAPKTPFKIPLNDENALGEFGGGKNGLKTVGKGNGNLVEGEKKGLANKNAFITPMGTLVGDFQSSNFYFLSFTDTPIEKVHGLEHHWVSKQPTPKPKHSRPLLCLRLRMIPAKQIRLVYQRGSPS